MPKKLIYKPKGTGAPRPKHRAKNPASFATGGETGLNPARILMMHH